MATIKLGARPKSFARVVKTKDVDGSELLVPVTYKYRTRKEYGEWIDAMPPYPEAKDAYVDAAKPTGADESDATSVPKVFSSEKYIELVSAWSAAKILAMLDGWGLDVEFSPENVRQMCDESPAAAEAVIEEYRAAIIEGRLGN